MCAREAWEIFFPLVAWTTNQSRKRKRYGVDSYIAAGLIRQGERFQPNAIVPGGFFGSSRVDASNAATGHGDLKSA